MNDFCKIVSIVSGIIVTGIFFPYLDFAYGESDFTLEAKVNEAASTLDITRFEIRGDSDKQICPSGQCIIDFTYNTQFSPPDPVSPSIGYNTKFVLIDKNNTTNSDIGPKKKQYLEQFDNTFGCKIEDIIEDNGKEIYYCHDKQSSIDRIFDSKSWNYDSIGVYDAKNHTFKVTGNLTGVFPSGR